MDVQNVNMQTALHLAVERQHTQIVRVSATLWLFILYSHSNHCLKERAYETVVVLSKLS